MENWHDLTYNGFDIGWLFEYNDLGQIRNKKTGHLYAEQKSGAVILYIEGDSLRVNINKLLGIEKKRGRPKLDNPKPKKRKKYLCKEEIEMMARQIAIEEIGNYFSRLS